MATMISKSAAIANAQSAAHTWYQTNQAKLASGQAVGVHNTGPMDTFVSSELADSVMADWKNKGDWNGLNRRASLTSGSSADQAVDLKLAQPGASASCFNYHVLIGKDPALIAKAKEIAAQALKSKQAAAVFKEKQAAEAKAKAEKAADPKAIKEAADAKKAAERKKQAMQTAYNAALKTDKNLAKTDKKAAWEKGWLEKNKNFK